MPWNDKCPNGGPDPFDADAAVAAADFSASVYVNTADVPHTNNRTRYAYTYVTVQDGAGQDWRVCIVGHIHYDGNAGHWVPGNTFIPGWANWEVHTSAAHAAAIQVLADHGAFPGAGRYPVEQ